MSQFVNLQKRLFAVETESTIGAPDEVLVRDVRGDLTPVQMVEQKLRALLNAGGSGVVIHPHDVREGVGRNLRGRAPSILKRDAGPDGGTPTSRAAAEYPLGGEPGAGSPLRRDLVG